MRNGPRLLVLFNSMKGCTYSLAKAIASGIEDFSGAVAVLKQVPRIHSLPDERIHEFDSVPVAKIDDLLGFDGIAFGSPIHFANISSDMRYFLDQSLSIWATRKLEGIPATVFMAAGSGAGRELAILSFWSTLAMHGMILVPTGMMGFHEIDKEIPQGYTPLGVSSLAGIHPAERPSEGEIHIARLQGFALAKAAKGMLAVRGPVNERTAF